MITLRGLEKNEIDKIKQIDRREEIFELYVYNNGILTLKPYRETIINFEKFELDIIINRQLKLKREEGQIIGAFDNDKLIGVVSVERKRRGIKSNYCKMDILYVSKDYRKIKIGQRLIDECKKLGKQFGADKLYVSATPTKNTVDFYLNNGAILTTELDSELYDLEPKDIHLELKI